MGEFNTLDDFLNHKGSEGGGGKRLKSWAKDPGYMNFWLHMKQMPHSVWFHRLFELVIRTDKDDKTKTLKNVWGRQHVCWEDESILKKQRYRTDEGRREHPPTKCGACRLTEAVRELILDGKIADTDILFKYEGADDPTENKVVHAGGLCNIWKFDDMTGEEKDRLKRAGVFASKVWSENGMAKLSYVFAGVNHDEPSAGLQIAVQNQLLGDKVKKTIRKEMASKDGDDGNPFIKPYCIRFVYQAEEKKFDDKYDAMRIDRFKLTPEIQKLISGERPDISRFTKKFNQKELRAALEKHATPLALKMIPWDAVFDVPGYNEEPEAEQEKVETRSEPKAEKAPTPAVELDDPCDDCGAEMRKGQTKCNKCGAKYADDAPAPEPKKEPAPAAPPSDSDAVYDTDVPF